MLHTIIIVYDSLIPLLGSRFSDFYLSWFFLLYTDLITNILFYVCLILSVCIYELTEQRSKVHRPAGGLGSHQTPGVPPIGRGPGPSEAPKSRSQQRVTVASFQDFNLLMLRVGGGVGANLAASTTPVISCISVPKRRVLLTTTDYGFFIYHRNPWILSQRALNV